MSKGNAGFRIKKITRIDDLENTVESEIPTSDLCISTDDRIIQFEYFENDDVKEKINIKPGCYTLNMVNNVIKPEKTDISTVNLLETIDNTHKVLHQVDLFSNKMPIYDELGIDPPRRSILLYSEPGCGKTVAIKKSIEKIRESDPGTVVFFWPTSEVDPEDIHKFLVFNSKYTKKCTKLIFVMEDIGGIASHGGPTRDYTTSGMLNLLDGAHDVFKIPTFIIATTNYPQNLQHLLADRPGRFDKRIKLTPPSYKERISLIEFISKEKLTDKQKEAFKNKKLNQFSIAHLKEIVIRSKLDDKSYDETVKEMVKEKEIFAKNFEEKGTMGLSGDVDF